MSLIVTMMAELLLLNLKTEEDFQRLLDFATDSVLEFDLLVNVVFLY